MHTISRPFLLGLIAFALFGCGGKAPEKPKANSRFMVETQKTPSGQFIVTMWNKQEVARAGSNVFVLEFQTGDKKPVDPGTFSIRPYFEAKGKAPLPGAATSRATDKVGVFDVFAELPSEGRWKFTVTAGGETVFFYYTARPPAARPPVVE